MATNTTNYNLEKPSDAEFYDIGVQNSNMDKIDAALADKADLDDDGKVLASQLPSMDYEAEIKDATSETTIADSDTIPFTDVSASNVTKKITWTNIKSVLKTYFDTLYNKVTVVNSLTSTSTTSALSAAQGKVLADDVANIEETVGNINDLLDTINGEVI